MRTVVLVFLPHLGPSSTNLNFRLERAIRKESNLRVHVLVLRVEVYKAGGFETVCVEEIELYVYLLVQIYSK